MINFSSKIIKAEHFGIKDLRSNATSETFKTLFVVTAQGKPVSVNLPYSDMLNLIDMLDEVSDPATLRLVKEHKDAVKAKTKPIPSSTLFKEMRNTPRKKT